MTAKRLDRRNFLQLSGTSLLLLGLRPKLSWARGGASAGAASVDSGVLVVFFQRGAADGLHMVVPYRDPAYRKTRGRLALSEPGRGADRTLDLGDGFALHPALGPLHSLHESRRLAVVHAVGSPHPTRSHFDAQDFMESGTPGVKSTRDGWLKRALSGISDRGGRLTPFSAIALTDTLPRSLAGARDAIAMPDFSRLERRRSSDDLTSRLERLYGQDEDPQFVAAGEEAFAAIRLFHDRQPLKRPVRAGVSYPRGKVARRFEQAAKLIKSDLGTRIVFIDSGGWDTHLNQGGADGQMARLLAGMGGSIEAFLADVGDDVSVTLLTATEFGRTAAPNGAGGTDHGHGTAMFVAGHGVAGGRVLGDWPGMGRGQLHEGRDLAVTTDFRDLFAEVATQGLHLDGKTELFPRHRRAKPLGVMI